MQPINVGDKFGLLTVLECKGNKALCRCTCGTEKWVLKDNLKRGRTKSCGVCGKKNRKYTPRHNIVGQRFGKLVVLEELGHGRVLCQCDCGNTKEVNKGHLILGNITSCGCRLKKSIAKNMVTTDRTVGGDCYLARIASNKPTARSHSGVRGVHWSKHRGKWVASIGFNNQKFNLGYFDSIEDAIKARKAGEDKYFGPLLDT